MTVTKRTKRHRGRARRTVAEQRAQLAQERRQVTLAFPQVIAFGDPALREAFRVWWHPWGVGRDFERLTGQDQWVPHRALGIRGFKVVPAKHPIERGDLIVLRKLDPGYFSRLEKARLLPIRRGGKGRRARAFAKPKTGPAPVQVLITLTYPLTEKRSKLVTIDRRFPGEIFALTHYFYRELYAEDEERGGKPGPMNGGKGPLLNRGRGPLVWGHDLGDLGFESCQYRAFDKRTAKKTGAEGEFTFGIGS